MKMAELLQMAHRGEQPENFEELQKEAALELEEEVAKRMHAIPIKRFDRNRDPRNYQLVKLVRRRDGNKCGQCGRSDDQTKYEVAHILPVELFPEFAFEEWNARMECHDCNHKGGTQSIRYEGKRVQGVRNILQKVKEWLYDRQ